MGNAASTRVSRIIHAPPKAIYEAIESQIALTLRTVAGLEVPEIAKAFLVSQETMAKRLTRARAKIRDAGIPYRVPEEHQLPDRLNSVLTVIYLTFNEGYLSIGGKRWYGPSCAMRRCGWRACCWTSCRTRRRCAACWP